MRVPPLTASWYRILCLAMLLVAAQHGAFVHDLGHLAHPERASQHAVEPPCDLCPAFAQAASPTFGHAFVLPALELARSQQDTAPLLQVADPAIPRPRSRGPPSLS